jgi:hypothetical protein
MNLENALIELDGARLYVGVATSDEAERLMIEPAAVLREAGVEIDDDPHRHPVSRFSIVRRDARHIYIIYPIPGDGINVYTIPLGYAM